MATTRGHKGHLTIVGDEPQGSRAPTDNFAFAGGLLEREEPPPELDQEETAQWNRIANSMPPGWFGGVAYYMLASLCCSIVSARRMESKIRTLRAADARADHLDVLQAHQREIGTICQ